MKKRSLSNRINSEKGAATVMVLCVILMLTVLGTVALAASALNVRLSGKVMNWTQEYYELDKQAEECVQSIDQQLIAAENDAKAYVQGRYDRMPPKELPTGYSKGVYGMYNEDMDNGSSNAQEFFYGHYKAVWTRTEGVTGEAIEITPQDYADDPDLSKRSAAYREDPSLTAEQAFSADVKNYTDELFDRIYFFMLSKRLDALSASSPSAIAIVEGNASSGDPCTDKFTKLGSASWDSIAPADGDVKLTIDVSNSSAEDPKEVHARISIVKPHYDTILQTISTPVYGNPVWTNAITAGGNINITSGSSVTVEGDVYASGTGGILVNGRGDNVIRGNVYTRGDLAIIGDNGRLQVCRAGSGSSEVSYEKKKLIYDNDYFFDTNRLGVNIDDFSAGNSATGLPFFFRDYDDRDNVYCNNLLVKEGVQGADLKVDGNVWTKDDIQMDGRSSSISIGTTTTSGSSVIPLTSYIGLNQFSFSEQEGTSNGPDTTKLSNDPNTSSSIINNFPFSDDGTMTDSSIIINSNFIVPGVAFYDFKGGPEDYLYNHRYYYKSAESVSARTTSPAAIITAYYYDGSSDVEHGDFTDDDNDDFDLITPKDELNDKKTALNSFIASNGVKTNILTDLTNPAGYVAGAALLQKPGSANAILYTSTTGSGIYLSDSHHYLLDYTELQNAKALMKAFDSKTGQFGKSDACDFSEMLSSNVPDSLSEVIDRTEEHTLDISSDPDSGFHEGIVYCKGNLNITGEGMFKGTIICTGNVTITGSPTIIYDENIIVGKLKEYKAVRDFFAKGNTDSIIDNIHEYSSTSGERMVLKRYRVLSWQEKAPAPGD